MAADPIPALPASTPVRQGITSGIDPDERILAALTRVLAGFGLASVAGGSWLARRADGEGARAFGQQTAAWGAVNLGIAGVSALRSGRSPVDPVRVRRILLVNAALDLGYIAAGAHVAAHRTTFGGRLTPQAARGHGLAVVLQGLGLLNLDLGFALALWRGTRGLDRR
jgi:hypothetical protein